MSKAPEGASAGGSGWGKQSGAAGATAAAAGAAAGASAGSSGGAAALTIDELAANYVEAEDEDYRPEDDPDRPDKDDEDEKARRAALEAAALPSGPLAAKDKVDAMWADLQRADADVEGEATGVPALRRASGGAAKRPAKRAPAKNGKRSGKAAKRSSVDDVLKSLNRPRKRRRESTAVVLKRILGRDPSSIVRRKRPTRKTPLLQQQADTAAQPKVIRFAGQAMEVTRAMVKAAEGTERISRSPAEILASVGGPAAPPRPPSQAATASASPAEPRFGAPASKAGAGAGAGGGGGNVHDGGGAGAGAGGSRVDDVVAQLEGPRTVSTLEKTSMDWDAYKESEGIAHSVEQFAKDGYVAKQEFLSRVDHRKFELEKAERARDRVRRR